MYSRKIIARILIATCLAGATSASLAQESVTEQLQRINESIALLNAKKQELELRAQIVAKQAEIDRVTNTDGINVDRVRHPVVQSIEGADGKMTAMLAFGSGLQQTVRQGDRIPGGWVIAKIGVDAVHIARGNEKVRLSYGHEPPPPMQTMTTVPPLNPIGR